MKKFLSILLVFVLLAGLCACDLQQVQQAAETVIEIAEALDETDDRPDFDDDPFDDDEDDRPAFEETAAPTAAPVPEATAEPEAEPEEALLPEDGSYDSKDEVALYIHQYSHLPQNFITKQEAQDLGWSGGGLEKYAPGKSIGGSRFGNYEGLLPSAPGRTYTECDIDTMGASSRGAKRIVFSNDGLIYYTDDHYESFTLLYGEP